MTTRRYDLVVTALAVATTAVHLWNPIFGAWPLLRVVSLSLFLTLALLTRPAWRGKSGPMAALGIATDVVLVSVALGVALYIGNDHLAFIEGASRLTDFEFLLGVAFIITILEAVRRHFGWALVILVLIFIAYAYWGRSMPLIIAHAGVSLHDIVEFSFRNSSGIYGLPVGVMASYIVLFILIGSILERSGAGEAFLDFAKAVAGRQVAGPAKIAVIGSAFVGSVSGSAVANVVTTGTVTVPMMKRIKLPPHLAAAIEATASTGGIITPPIMGAVAFVAASYAGVPYIEFMVAAIIPALLFHMSLFLFVDLEGRKRGLGGLARADIPRMRDALRRAWWIPFPFAALVTLLAWGVSPVRSAGFGLLVLSGFVLVVNGPRAGGRAIYEGMVETGKSMAGLMVVAAVAGIIAAMIFSSGIGLRFGAIVQTLGGGNLTLSLMLLAAVTIILGMGLPLTAAFLTAATLSVPAMIQLGASPMAANMFVMYFAAISAITPPVALAAFAAANVAGADFWRTGFLAVKLGFTGFIVPFLFVFRPALLLDGAWWEVCYAIATATLGIVAIAVALSGHWRTPIPLALRFALGGAGLLLALFDQPYLDAVGVSAVVALFVFGRRRAPAFQSSSTTEGSLHDRDL